MDFFVWFTAALIAGAALGSVGTWWWTRGRGGGDTIGQLKRENERFREEVAEHFVETARLINRMTDSYKDVFDHLSRGAGSLVDEKRLKEKMPRVSGEEVRLRHLGAPEPGRAGKIENSPKPATKPPESKSSAEAETGKSASRVEPPASGAAAGPASATGAASKSGAQNPTSASSGSGASPAQKDVKKNEPTSPTPAELASRPGTGKPPDSKPQSTAKGRSSGASEGKETGGKGDSSPIKEDSKGGGATAPGGDAKSGSNSSESHPSRTKSDKK